LKHRLTDPHREHAEEDETTHVGSGSAIVLPLRFEEIAGEAEPPVAEQPVSFNALCASAQKSVPLSIRSEVRRPREAPMLVAQKLATFLKLLRSIALSVLLLILLTWNFGTLNTSAREVLAMVPRIQQFEASGVKLVLKDEVKLRAALVAALDGALPDDGKREAINAVQKLTGPQVDRLFTILPEGSHCDYTLATAKMRLYFNSDAELEDLGLVVTTQEDTSCPAAAPPTVASQSLAPGDVPIRSTITLNFCSGT